MTMDLIPIFGKVGSSFGWDVGKNVTHTTSYTSLMDPKEQLVHDSLTLAP